jgi:hypothetical protein
MWVRHMQRVCETWNPRIVVAKLTCVTGVGVFGLLVSIRKKNMKIWMYMAVIDSTPRSPVRSHRQSSTCMPMEIRKHQREEKEGSHSVHIS